MSSRAKVILREQVRKTAIMLTVSIVAAIFLDYLINVVLMPGVTPYTPWGTVVTAGLIAAPSWWFVIGQRLALQTARDDLAATLAARDAAESQSAEKSRFLATMSHELRTPLNAIIGYSEILSEGAEEDGRARDVADHARVLESARHLLALVDDVLELSALESGRIALNAEAFDASTLARRAMAGVRNVAAANGVELQLRIASDVGAARTDAARLSGCLSHLLNNAVMFARDGQVALKVTLQLENGRDMLVFEVTDTGPGISPAQQERLFEAFNQIDNSATREHGGAGLGLALTRRIARRLGGDLVVSSRLGAGSVFRLSVCLDAGEIDTPPVSNVTRLRAA
ncbi:MAG: HAMP domain-containing sensor histidine kinase [Alphaproteobacteria bacterium]|nr:HAMP domain-containing sensor histidine kinase [Alphaproteobacteria bacterium]